MENIILSFSKNNITHTLSIPNHDMSNENLPYDIADIFITLIKESNVNEQIVINSLIDEFGYEGKEK